MLGLAPGLGALLGLPSGLGSDEVRLRDGDDKMVLSGIRSGSRLIKPRCHRLLMYMIVTEMIKTPATTALSRIHKIVPVERKKKKRVPFLPKDLFMFNLDRRSMIFFFAFQ